MPDAELCRAVYRAMIAKDIPALSAVLDDGFILVHMTGLRQSKAAFLQAVADGTLNYYRCEDDALDVAVRNGEARLVGRSRVSAAVFGGDRHTWRLRQDMTLARRDGGWRITLSVASAY